MNQNLQMDKLFLLSETELAEQIDAARRDVQNAEARLAEAQQKDQAERDDWEKAQTDFKQAETAFYQAREKWQLGDKRSNDVASEVVRSRQILNFLNGEGARRAAA